MVCTSSRTIQMIAKRTKLDLSHSSFDAGSAQGHFTSGGMDDRMLSTLPPVLRPKVVPRS